MKKQPWVIIVPGYGCHLTKELCDYLDEVVCLCRQKNQPDLIITTGGYTNETSATGVSEAGMMREYLLQRGVHIPIIADEKAKTTNDNLHNAKDILRKHGYNLDDTLVCIFCDQCRIPKVVLLAKIIFGRLPDRIYAYPITRGKNSYLFQLLFATPLDVLAEISPSVMKLKLALVRRKIRKS